MAGKLVQVATETVTSATASVTLTGIDSDDVYMVTINKVFPVNDNVYLRGRFTESGTPNTTSNYDSAYKNLYSSSVSNSSYTNQSSFYITNNYIGTGTQEQFNAVCYIFNSQNSGEYTFLTQETISRGHTYSLWGNQGGGVLTVSSTVDGINFFMDSGNIASGTFTLYKVV